MLAVALLGGLILNVMPCVLPVLSLKLLAARRARSSARRAVRRGFLGTAAGILLSFLALAAATIGADAGRRRGRLGRAVPGAAVPRRRWRRCSRSSPPISGASSRCRCRAASAAPSPSAAPLGNVATGAFATLAGDAVLGAVPRHRAGLRARRRAGRDRRDLPGARHRLGRALSAGRGAAAASRALLPRPGRWMVAAAARARRGAAGTAAVARRRCWRPRAARCASALAGVAALRASLAALAVLRAGAVRRRRWSALLAVAAALAPLAARAPHQAPPATRWRPFDPAALGAARPRRPCRLRRCHRRLVPHLQGQRAAGARQRARCASELDGAAASSRCAPTGRGPIRRSPTICGASAATAFRSTRSMGRARRRAGAAGNPDRGRGRARRLRQAGRPASVSDFPPDR